MKWNENADVQVCKLLIDGGQGRNRTADASLFRAVFFRRYLFHSTYVDHVSAPTDRRVIGTNWNQHQFTSGCEPRQAIDHSTLRLRNKLLIDIQGRAGPECLINA